LKKLHSSHVIEDIVSYLGSLLGAIFLTSSRRRWLCIWQFHRHSSPTGVCLWFLHTAVLKDKREWLDCYLYPNIQHVKCIIY